MRLFTFEEAVEDFWVNLRDLSQADLVGFPGPLSTWGGLATEVDLKLWKVWVKFY